MSQAEATVVDLLNKGAERPGAVFLTMLSDSAQTQVITYRQQCERTRLCAGALASYGVGEGDRVHLRLSNRPEFYDIWFASVMLGAVMVPTNPQGTTHELAHILDDARPSISIVEEDDPWYGLDGDEKHLRITVRELESRAAVYPVSRPVNPFSTAAVLYTSGTTSRPKGVQVTHANYEAVGHAVTRGLKVTERDRWLVSLPLFHANAQYYCTMSALVAGASTILAPRFSASQWPAQAARHEATLASLFAAPLRMVLRRLEHAAEVPNCLRAVVFAQNITDEEARDFEATFDTTLVQLYGMTETVLPPTMNSMSDRMHDSIGRPLGEVDLRRDEPDREFGLGDEGELVVRGRRGLTLAAGYLNSPRGDETFGESWVRTGDIVRRGDDGRFYFVSRKKEMIKRSGENVSPGEVEATICLHPDVSECAAVGAPDPLRDEQIVVFVVPTSESRLSEREVLNWCRRYLSAFKVPSRVRLLEELPKTAVGKVQKTVLAEAIAHDDQPGRTDQTTHPDGRPIPPTGSRRQGKEELNDNTEK